MIKLGTVSIRFIWNWDLESSLLRCGWNNGGILGILIGLKMGEGLSIVRILVLSELKDLIGIMRMMWCLTRCGGVMGIGDS